MQITTSNQSCRSCGEFLSHAKAIVAGACLPLGVRQPAAGCAVLSLRSFLAAERRMWKCWRVRHYHTVVLIVCIVRRDEPSLQLVVDRR